MSKQSSTLQIFPIHFQNIEAVRATAFWRTTIKVVAFHDTPFAYRKTAGQVSPYGGRMFICRTSRCVYRCGPASAPEHHLLCGRQVASPGEYDIPDDLPNRRTGHGRGSYPAAARPLPAMLRPAPAARSSSHALWLVCSLF